jgi:DNA-binding NarL/FixJ family response regulator
MTKATTRILLVDDHPGIRTALKVRLDSVPNFDVIGDIGKGGDVPPAMERWEPDLVILDLEMERGYDPAKAVEHIRKVAPDTKIVVYSAHEDYQVVTTMLDLCVDGYILKTEEMASVVASLQEIVAGERRYSPGLVTVLADANWDTKSLSPMERSVLQMLADGKSVHNIAHQQQRSDRSVSRYISELMKKLNATSLAHAVAIGFRKHIIV